MDNIKNLFQSRLEIFFDAGFYIQLYPEISEYPGSPLEHYLKYGWYESRKPNSWYSDALVPVKMLTQFAGSPSFVIFLTYLPNLTVLEFEQLCFDNKANESGHEDCIQCQIMREEFNPKYYRYKYPDTKNVYDALAHFCEVGWKERKNPNFHFDTDYYLTVNQDVAAANVNPFVHFLSQKNEGRLPKAAVNVRKQLLRSLRSVNYISSEYDDITPKVIFKSKDLLFNKLASIKNKLCLSISNDDYISPVGETQQFIKNESELLLEAGFTYLNMNPTKKNNKLVQGDIENTLINCSFNNIFFGTFVAKEIVEIFKKIKSTNPDIFHFGVIHSVMGWNIKSLISIFEVKFKKNYFFVHDYYSICHERRLLRNNIETCDGPALSSAVCSICINKTNRDIHLMQFEILFEALKPVLIFPSKTAEKIFKNAEQNYNLDYKQVSPLKIIKIDKDADNQVPMKEVKSKIKLAFIGNSTSQQGFYHFSELVHECLLLDEFEFLHFGEKDEALARVTFIETTGETAASNIAELLIKYEVDIVFLPSIWRETFNYIAYDVLNAGSAIITLENSGDIAELVHTYSVGAVVRDESSASRLLHSLDIKTKLIEWKRTASQIRVVNNHSFLLMDEDV